MDPTRYPVRRISVRGFRSFRDSEIELSGLNVLIGANGAGKSNLLQLFLFLEEILHGRMQSYVARRGGASALLFGGPKRTPACEVSVSFGADATDQRYTLQLGHAQPDRLVFLDERVEVHGAGQQPTKVFALGAGHDETNLGGAAFTNLPVFLARSSMKAWRVYHFHDTSPEAPVKQAGDIGYLSGGLAPRAENLAALLRVIRETNGPTYRRIVATIRLVAPFFGDFVLEPYALNPRRILLRWSDRSVGTEFGADDLSDGTLRFICLTVLLLQPELPSTVLIDEPELGLHPAALQVLAGMIQEARTRAQIVIATQSAALLDAVAAPEDVLIMERDAEGGSAMRRLDASSLVDWLDSYSLGELWLKNVLGGRPRR